MLAEANFKPHEGGVFEARKQTLWGCRKRTFLGPGIDRAPLDPPVGPPIFAKKAKDHGVFLRVPRTFSPARLLYPIWRIGL